MSELAAAELAQPSDDRTARIRQLNDELRQRGRGGRVLMSAGVAALPGLQREAVMSAVRRFDAFGPDNDPYGEHDFGLIQVSGQLLLWKVDAYDKELAYGSPDQADPSVTIRIMTVMLTEEY